MLGGKLFSSLADGGAKNINIWSRANLSPIIGVQGECELCIGLVSFDLFFVSIKFDTVIGFQRTYTESGGKPGRKERGKEVDPAGKNLEEERASEALDNARIRGGDDGSHRAMWDNEITDWMGWGIDPLSPLLPIGAARMAVAHRKIAATESLTPTV